VSAKRAVHLTVVERFNQTAYFLVVKGSVFNYIAFDLTGK
jgi:hypothetical protein